MAATETFMTNCPICDAPTDSEALRNAAWLPPALLTQLTKRRPDRRGEDGACPNCVRQAALFTLFDVGETALREELAENWFADAGSAFAALPTVLRLRADPRYTGKGVTIALIDFRASIPIPISPDREIASAPGLMHRARPYNHGTLVPTTDRGGRAGTNTLPTSGMA